MLVRLVKHVKTHGVAFSHSKQVNNGKHGQTHIFLSDLIGFYNSIGIIGPILFGLTQGSHRSLPGRIQQNLSPTCLSQATKGSTIKTINNATIDVFFFGHV